VVGEIYLIKVLHLRDTNKVCGPGKTILETTARIDTSRFNLSIGLFMDKQDQNNLYHKAAIDRNIDVIPIKTSNQFDPRIISQVISIVKSRGFDIIHSHEYKSDMVALIAGKYLKVPIITTAHGWITNSLKSKIYISVGKKILPWFDYVIAVSPKIKEELQRVGVKSSKIKLIYNAIVMEDYIYDQIQNNYLIENYGIPENAKIIGCVGRLSPEKGQLDLLYAANKVLQINDQIYFVFVGDGPDRGRLENTASQLGIADNIIFTGHLRDVRPVYRDINILALTSYTEGFPNVVLEALCMNRPVLATNVGGTGDIIKNNKTGILVEPGNIDQIVAGLFTLLDNDVDSYRLVQNGRQLVTEQYQFEARVEKVQNLYEKIMNSNANL